MPKMSIIEAIILGLIQGLTEFIPVSSSGHLLLAHELFGSDNATLGFDVALHVGTLVALVAYFWSDIWKLVRSIHKKNSDGVLARVIVAATLPAAAVGYLFSRLDDDTLRTPLIVAIMLAGVGVLMIVADGLSPSKKQEVTLKRGMAVGLAQCLALIPGTSRSGITMTAGLISGLTRKNAAHFAFLLAIPIIAGSAVGLYLEGDLGGTNTDVLAVGMVTAFASGLAAIKLFLGVVERVGLKPFAYYRIGLAVVIMLALVML